MHVGGRADGGIELLKIPFRPEVFETVTKNLVEGGYLDVAPLFFGAEAIDEVLKEPGEGITEGEDAYAFTRVSFGEGAGAMDEDAGLAAAGYALQNERFFVRGVCECLLIGVKEEHPVLEVDRVEQAIELLFGEAVNDEHLVGVDWSGSGLLGEVPGILGWNCEAVAKTNAGFGSSDIA